MCPPVPRAGDAVAVREFRRSDRDQLAALVNAHIAAVLPGGSVSVQTLLSHLEDEPQEYVVNPWVAERVTLVAEQRSRLVAAAHLVRYRDDADVGPSYRNLGEIRFLIFWPPSPLFPRNQDAARHLLARCAERLHGWRVSRVTADGSLPAPAVYGVPDQWPHVRTLYRDHGFVEPARTEIVLVARVADLHAPTGGITAARSVGVNGTRIDAMVDGSSLGFIEVDTTLDGGPRTSRLGSWADIGNLHVGPTDRRDELTRWLLGRAADWLTLGGTTHLLAYAGEDSDAERETLQESGFQVLTTVGRGYALGDRPE